MSEFLVLDEFGSDGSRDWSSMQRAAHGELGVTCNAAMPLSRTRMTSRSAAPRDLAMASEEGKGRV
jgi:hypothetical protein